MGPHHTPENDRDGSIEEGVVAMTV